MATTKEQRRRVLDDLRRFAMKSQAELAGLGGYDKRKEELRERLAVLEDLSDEPAIVSELSEALRKCVGLLHEEWDGTSRGSDGQLAIQQAEVALSKAGGR